jgi:hypothetical protein
MYNEVRAKTISELKREMMHGLLKSKKDMVGPINIVGFMLWNINPVI